MKNLAVKAENISKQYRLGEVGTGTLSHDLNRIWSKFRGKEDPYLKIGEANDRTSKGVSDYVWSLRDINFEIEQGDAVGIIGRNGAGKSTLLKLLSKVTKPTTGSFKVNGRIASLLEVGTGFNPEMTGRENIYLNGSILGMRRHEITRKFDEIVDFSGVERYIDTPVKRYSSGMYVRLAFAVAAHLESEILIVDEVLAVGDAEFQKKCIGKMGDVSKGEGRTVLFVSHNMAAVKSLCNNGIVLNKGIIEHIGEINSCVSLYLGGGNKGITNIKSFKDIFVKDVFNFNQIAIKSSKNSYEDLLLENNSLELTSEIEMLTDEPERYHITYHLYNELGEPLFSFSSKDKAKLKKGINKLTCLFPENFFQSGNYSLSLFVVVDKRTAIYIENDIFIFTVVDRARELGVFMGREPGYIKPQFTWTNE
ncbi:polysaccharide ABC transporter ATP-binding protein [Flavobacterium sp.]|uniref:ABC transporter ATP-binding protein n=1 Tax=Flavobacterium sp. TaxID=239 RepID=UPI0038FC3EC0